MTTDIFESLFIFLLGLEFGSFANVCIYRWPRSASVSSPRRSFCPWCKRQLSWLDNIPVLSFIFLRGRCRQCASPISPRYPMVELTTALLWLGAHRVHGPISSATDAVFLAGVLGLLFVAVVTTMTDLDWRIIPDEASGLLVAIGLLSAAANPLLGNTPVDRIIGAVVGLAVSGGFIWAVGEIGSRLLAKDAMGGGDVKLMAGVGAVLGWEAGICTLFVGAILGGLFSIVGMLRGSVKRGHYIPFGPFLNAAAILILFHLISGGEIFPVLHRIWM